MQTITAIEDNNKAVSLLPESAETYYNRGLTKCKLSDEGGLVKKAFKLGYKG